MKTYQELLMEMQEYPSECLKEAKVNNVDISIVIPTFRRAKYLKVAIDSAVQQYDTGDIYNYEIIVINNDPETQMDELIQQYRDCENILFYRNIKNIGMVANINRGIVLAKGKYIAYLHDDDLLENNYIKEIRKIIHSDRYGNKFAYCINRNNIYENKDHITNAPKYNEKNLVKACLGVLFLWRYLYRKKVEKLSYQKVLIGWSKNFYLAPTCGNIFNRDMMKVNGAFEEKYFPAFDYVYYLSSNINHDILFIRKKLGIYRWANNESFNSDVRKKTIKTRMDIINYNFKDTKCKKIFNKYKKAMLYIELNKMSLEEQNEFCDRNDININLTHLPKINMFRYKCFCYTYKKIHNLDY